MLVPPLELASRARDHGLGREGWTPANGLEVSGWGEVALQLTRQGVPFLIYSGRADDVNRPPELANVTWVEKPATAQNLLKALGHLRAQAAVAS